MTDASIPLQIRPPQFEQPLDVYSKAMSLRRMQTQANQQDQLFPLQLKSAQMQNQAQERALKDQEIWRQSHIDALGDLDKTEQLATQRGASLDSISTYRKNRIGQQHQLAQNKQLDLKNLAEQGDLIHGRALAFQAKPQEQKEEEWPDLIANLHKDKLLTPEAAAQLLQHYPKYPGDAEMSALIADNQSGTQMAREAAARDLAARRQAASDVQAQRADTAAQLAAPKLAQAKRDAAIAALRTSTSQQDYTNRLNKLDLPDELYRQFPKDFDPETTPAQLDQIGMTPAQRTTAVDAQTREDRARQTAEEMSAYRKAQLGLAGGRLGEERRRTDIMEERAARGGMSMTEATRQARGSEKAENDQRQLGEQLASAIQGGKIYVDKSGRVGTLATTAPERQAQMEDMKARYRANAEAMKTTIHDKYDAYERLGMTNPKVSRAQAVAGIDAGTEKLLAPVKQQPAAAAKPAAKGKLDEATAQKFWDASGHDKIKARKMAQDAGYTF